MPEKNKREAEKKENAEKKTEKEKDNWSEDQKNRRYYYDDSHGYEIYNPDKDEEQD